MPTSCHVLLYGPPGAGTLTTAHAIGELTGARVLDNHLSMDPALRLFEFPDDDALRPTPGCRASADGAFDRRRRDPISRGAARRRRTR